MSKKVCTAKAKHSGEKCKNSAMPNGKCRYHGGKSTGNKTPKASKTNSIKHGFYSSALTPDERKLFDQVEIGTIDDEIKILKIKLHRLVRLSNNSAVAELIDSAIEATTKISEHPDLGLVDKKEIKVLVPQYSDLIIQAIEKIGKLEVQRLQIKLLESKVSDSSKGSNNEVVGFEVNIYDE